MEEKEQVDWTILYRYLVLDTECKEIRQITGSNELPLSDLVAGIYYLVIEMNEHFFTEKVIKIE